MITFTTIVKQADGTWKFDWTPVVTDEYRIVLEGSVIDTIDEPPYICYLPRYVIEPPDIQVLIDDELIENKPFIEIQWWPVLGATEYVVQRHNGVTWTTFLRVSESDAPLYTIKTRIEEDGTIAQYRVLAQDSIEQLSSPIEITITIVTAPVISIGDTEVSYTPNTISVE